MFRFVLLILITLPALSGCGYNTMQTNEEAVFAAWGDVEATYQRRADLIPNLVEAVKGYADPRKGNPAGGHRGPRQGRPGKHQRR